MARFRRAARWAALGLLATVGFLGQGVVQAQDSVLLPPIGTSSVKPPRFARGTAPAAPYPILELTAAAPPLVTLPAPIDPPAHLPPLDDGLGARMIPPAAPPPSCPAECKEDKPAGGRFAKVPPVDLLPRAGWFPIAPSGPGSYTFVDFLQDDEREAPPKYPYPRISPFVNSYFDVDWRYLDDPQNAEPAHLGDALKRRHCGPNDQFLLTAGGELRARYTYENNTRLSNVIPLRERGAVNNYDLYRLRVFGDLYVTERFRLFAEFLSATSPDWLLPPLPLDRDPADFLNLFADANLLDIADTPVWLRVGRQELLYGSQRLISPLDWANSRRTFQGVKAFWHSDKDAVDLFCVQPVIPNEHRFDSVDNNAVFAGLWYTHRPKASDAIDAYYLMLDVTNPVNTGRFDARGGYTAHTLGSRWTGQKDNWLWDVEGMVQFGESVNQGLFARAFTMGGGYYFKDCPGTPTAWLYYDYASGTPDPGAGHLNQTFHQLFPFGHYYFGWADVVGRRNINDANAEVTVYPTKWLFVQGQCHNFWLDSPKDALYNTAGVATRRDPTGNSGSYVGTEVDLIVNVHLTDQSDLLLVYSHLFAGEFLEKTATTPGGRNDPQAVYVQYSYRW